jgi:hypothetical protein
MLCVYRYVQDVGAVRRAYTEANMEAEIQGQKLTEVITKLKGDLKTVAEVCMLVLAMGLNTLPP